ncbi:MAG: DUF4271 domain-containing protein [Bacteroidales bacterium]
MVFFNYKYYLINTFLPVKPTFYLTENKNNLYFLFLVLSLVLITALFLTNKKRVKLYVNSIWSKYGINTILKNGNFIGENISFLLYLIYIINTSMFFVYIYYYCNSNTILNNNAIYIITSIVILFPIFKYLLYSYAGFLFNNKSGATELIANNIIFNGLSGIILFPLLFFVIFSTIPFLKITSIILLLIFAINFIKTLIMSLSDFKFSNVFFITYLCIIKLFPVALIIIYIVNNIKLI